MYDFVETLKRVFNKNKIEILEFNGEKSSIKYKCIECGEIYNYKNARNLLTKITLCSKCYKPYSRWNKERLQERLELLFPNSDFVLLNYQGLRKSCKIKCNKCGKIEIINNIEAVIIGRKEFFCSNCEKDKNKIYNHIQKELKKGYLELLEWKGTNDYSKFKCKRCGHIFEKKVRGNFDGKICPNCFKVYNKFDFKQGQEFLNQVGNNEYELLQFTGTNNKSLIKHNCGFVFSKRISELGRGCPKCYSKMSLLEQKVRNFLINNGYDFVFQKRYEDLKSFSFDFCVFTKDKKEILIEVQGQQHYYTVNDAYLGTIEDQKRRDTIKREYCLANNIPLIEVPYWEIKNLNNYLKLKLNDYLDREQG